MWTLIASLYIGNVMLLVLNYPLIPLWVKLLALPRVLLSPAPPLRHPWRLQPVEQRG